MNAWIFTTSVSHHVGWRQLNIATVTIELEERVTIHLRDQGSSLFSAVKNPHHCLYSKRSCKTRDCNFFLQMQCWTSGVLSWACQTLRNFHSHTDFLPMRSGERKERKPDRILISDCCIIKKCGYLCFICIQGRLYRASPLNSAQLREGRSNFEWEKKGRSTKVCLKIWIFVPGLTIFQSLVITLTRFSKSKTITKSLGKN